MVQAPTPAAAQRLVVADFYAEPDMRTEAGALSLLVRSRLYVGRRPVVPRAALLEALSRMSPVLPQAGIVIDPGRVSRLLPQLGADRLLTGSVRRDGTGYAVTLRAYDDRGTLLGSIVENVSHGRVAELADRLAHSAAELVEARVFDHVGVAYGKVLPFVAAHQALLAHDPKRAARALAAADSVVAARVPPAREIVEAVRRDSRLSVEERLHCALVGGDARVALEIAAEQIRAMPTSEIAWGVRARAHLSQLKLDAAAEDLERVARSRHPMVRLARAELAHRRGDVTGRDESLAALLGAEMYVPALVWVASLPPTALGELEEEALSAAAAMIVEVPHLAATLGYRAALGGVEVERALGLVSIEGLDEDEVAAIAPVVDALAARDSGIGLRLRGELRLRDGDIEAAIADLRRAVQRSPDQVETRVLLARALTGSLDHAGAVEELERVADLSPDFRRGYARALERNGDHATASAIFRDMGDPTSVESQIAVAERHLEKSAATAVRVLERVLIEAPEDVRVLRALAGAHRARGNAYGAAEADALADLLDDSGRALAGQAAEESAAGSMAAEEEGPSGSASVLAVVLVVAVVAALAGAALLFLRLRRAAPAAQAPSYTPAGFAAGAVAAQPPTPASPPVQAPPSPSLEPEPIGLPPPPGPAPLGGSGPPKPSGAAPPGPSPLGELELDLLPVPDPRAAKRRRGITEDPLASLSHAEFEPAPPPAPTPHLPPPPLGSGLEEDRGDLGLDLELGAAGPGDDLSPADDASDPDLLELGHLGAGEPTPSGTDPERPRRRRRETGLERYRPLGKLARHALGQLYRARDQSRDHDVALLIFERDLFEQNPVAVRTLFSALERVAELEDEHIVRVLAWGQDGGQTYLVTEHVKGSTLELRLQRSEFSAVKALALVEQLAAAAAHAHERSVYHLDIAPSNIQLTGDDRVKLGGFGLAEVRNRYSESHGDPLYMAPEQFRGVAADHRSDLYSIGCVAFELLTGRTPFVDGDLRAQHLELSPRPPSVYAARVPAQVDALVMSCLAKDKNSRVASAAALRASIATILESA